MNVRHILAAAVLLVFAPCAYAEDVGAERQYFQLPEMAALDLPFSDAVLVGDTLYLAGTGGIDVTDMSVPEDPKDEVRLMMENYKKVLAMADMTLDDLVSVTIYCSDLSLYGDFNEVYRSYFDKDFPARAFIGSAPLLFGMRFEIQGIAVRSP